MTPELEADRAASLHVPCPSCAQPAGQICVRAVDRKPLERAAAHTSRLKKASVIHAPLDSRDLRHDPDHGRTRW